LKKKIIFILLLLGGVFVFTTKESEKKLTEIWAHRGGEGFFKSESNLQASILKTKKWGWTGVELDCQYDSRKNKIYVSHKNLNQTNLENLPVLNDLHFPDDLPIWLDFKNLGDVKIKDLSKVKSLLKEVSKEHLLFLESQNFLKLKYLASKKIKTVFFIPIFFENTFFVYILDFLTFFFQFDGISVPIGHFELVKNIFLPEEIFVFTINSKFKICEILKNNSARVILSKIPPKHLHCM